VCVDVYDNGTGDDHDMGDIDLTAIRINNIYAAWHDFVHDDHSRVAVVELRAACDKYLAASDNESGGVDLNLGEPDYAADVDARAAVNIYQLRAAYVDASARYEHAWRAGHTEDDFRTAADARYDAARALVAALDAAEHPVGA
jgi:hypothetical protein